MSKSATSNSEDPVNSIGNPFNKLFTVIAVSLADILYKLYRVLRYRVLFFMRKRVIQLVMVKVLGREYSIEYPEVPRHWSYIDFSVWFRTLDSNIQTIGSQYNTSDYVARSLLLSVLSGFTGIVAGFGIVSFISSNYTLPEIESSISFNVGVPIWVVDLAYSIGAVLVVPVGSLVIGSSVGVLVFYGTIYWTSYVKSEMTREVEEMYPYGITFMYALSKTTEDVEKLIRVTSRQKSVLGPFANELQDIVNYVDLYNISFIQALNQKQTETESKKIRNLMQVFSQAYKQGGGISDILADFHRQSVEVEENQMEERTEFKELLVEMMLTIGAGVAIVMVLFVGLTLLAPIEFSILIMTGIGSFAFYIVFAVLIYYMDRRVEVSETNIDVEDYDFFAKFEKYEDLEDIGIISTTDIHSSEMDESFHFRVKKVNTILDYLRVTVFSPLKTMSKKPITALFVTIPLTILYYVFIVGFSTVEVGDVGVPLPITQSEFVGDPIIGVWTVIFIPYIITFALPALFYELKARRKRKIFSDLPIFTDSLNRTIQTGESMKDAVSTKGLTDITPALREELERTTNEIKWFGNPNKALSNLTTRLDIEEFTQVMAVVITTSQVSQNLEEALDIASTHLSRKRSIIEKEKSTGSILSVLSLIISMFFVGIYVMMEKLFITTFMDLVPEGDDGGVGQLTSGSVDFAAVDAGLVFIAILWAVVMIQLGGQLKSQSVFGSIKYGIIGILLSTIAIVLGVTFAPTI